MKSQKVQQKVKPSNETDPSCCLYFSNAAKYILNAPVSLTKYVIQNPGKALVSALAIQSQFVSARDTKPVISNDGVGFQNTNTQGDQKSSVSYNPRTETYTAEHRQGSDQNYLYVKAQTHESFYPESATVEVGMRMEVGGPRKRK